MRSFLLALAVLTTSGVAVAQDVGFAIEDDVSRENAVSCAALRKVMTEADRRTRGSILLDLATRDGAWTTYLKGQPQYGDPARLQADVSAEAARLASVAKEAIAKKADDCSVFEIRSAPPAGG